MRGRLCLSRHKVESDTQEGFNTTAEWTCGWPINKYMSKHASFLTFCLAGENMNNRILECPTLHSAFQCLLTFWGTDDPFFFPDATHISLCISSSEPLSPTTHLLGFSISMSHHSHWKQVPMIPVLGRDTSNLKLLLSKLCSAKGLRLTSSSL